MVRKSINEIAVSAKDAAKAEGEIGEKANETEVWLPKPATSQLPHEGRALRATWSSVQCSVVSPEKNEDDDEDEHEHDCVAKAAGMSRVDAAKMAALRGEQATGKSPEPADRNVRPTEPDAEGFRLRPYQRAVFLDQTSGVVVLHWSRQVGKSYVLAAWAVWRIVSRPGRLVTVLSNSRENGAEFLRKCAEICRAFEFGFEPRDQWNSQRIADTRMELRIRTRGRTGRIKVLAANPRTARGFSGDLILDEFAFHEDSVAIWEAAEPILASHPDYLCRIASTGNGRHNMFYRMVEGEFLTTDGHGETRMGNQSGQGQMTKDQGMTKSECRMDGPVIIPDDRTPEEQWEQWERARIKNEKLRVRNEGAERKTPLSPCSLPAQSRGESEADAHDCLEGAGHAVAEGESGVAAADPADTAAVREPYYKSKAGFWVSRVPRSLAYAMGTPIYDPLTRKETRPEAARAKALDKRAYDQNYECAFADEQLTLLTYELIGAAERPGVGVVCEQGWNQEALYLMRQARNPLFVGFDVARKQDLSVITVVEKAADVHLVRGILRMRDLRLTEQEVRLAEVCRLPQFRRVAIDMTGLGLGLFEHAQKQFGASRIQGINFGSTVPAGRTAVSEGRRRETVRVTEALAMELLRLYEERRIEHPEDELLREDLRKPEKVTTPGGRVSIAATRDEAGHADHFWSLALAVEAGAAAQVPFAIQNIKLTGKGLII